MSPAKKLSRFEKERNQAFKYYFEKWRGNEGITPAFKQKVLVTRSGWDYIVNPPRERTMTHMLELASRALRIIALVVVQLF